MDFLIAGLLIAISIGLGFVIKRQAPKLHIIMCLLIAFAIALIIGATIAQVLGAFGP